MINEREGETSQHGQRKRDKGGAFPVYRGAEIRPGPRDGSPDKRSDQEKIGVDIDLEGPAEFIEERKQIQEHVCAGSEKERENSKRKQRQEPSPRFRAGM